MAKDSTPLPHENPKECLKLKKKHHLGDFAVVSVMWFKDIIK